jgi:CRISPR-associated protein (TIGR03984 family)
MSAERPFLLAHLDSGVVWGKWHNGRLLTSYQVAQDAQKALNISPRLLGLTLHQAFIFGLGSEVRLFRNELGHWQAYHIEDNDADSYMESQLLIGDEICHEFDEFTHLRDKKQQGLDQIVPLKVTPAVRRQLANKNKTNHNPYLPHLEVRHFIEEDKDTGEARIFLSRLVRVYWANNEG